MQFFRLPTAQLYFSTNNKFEKLIVDKLYLFEYTLKNKNFTIFF